MCEAVEVSTPRARPAAIFWIRTFGMRHFIYNRAFDATSRFAAYEFVLLYVLHKILSIEKLSIIAGFSTVNRGTAAKFRLRSASEHNLFAFEARKTLRLCSSLVFAAKAAITNEENRV